MSDYDKTIVSVDFTPNEAKAALEALKRAAPDLIKTQRELAKLVRSKYLSLIESGFSPNDAIELCKKLEW